MLNEFQWFFHGRHTEGFSDTESKAWLEFWVNIDRTRPDLTPAVSA